MQILQFWNSVYCANLLQFIQARVSYWKIRHTKLHAAIEWRIECEQPLYRSMIGEERAPNQEPEGRPEASIETAPRDTSRTASED